MSKWASNCCLASNKQYSVISRREQVKFMMNTPSGVRFVINEHAYLDIHSASALQH